MILSTDGTHVLVSPYTRPLDHKVCEGESNTRSKGSTKPFPTLAPGSKFVTPFGVVKVIADTRAKPTAVLPATIKKDSRNYNSSKQKSASQNQKGWMALAVKSRIRRERLRRLYETGRIDQKSVWSTYGGAPSTAEQDKTKQTPLFAPTRPDPLFPEKSYPDRIVECVLIPDERKKYDETAAGSDDDDDDDDEVEMQVSSVAASNDGPSPYGMKLFLQRKMLKEKYSPSTSVYTCQDCGQKFASYAGYTYHSRSQVCVTKGKNRAAAAREQLETIEARMARAIKNMDRPNRVASKHNLAVYPSVWISLGFEFLPTSKEKREEAVQVVEREEGLNRPDEVLDRLRNELRREKDRELGAVYPGVLQSLGFQRPSSRQKVAKAAKKKKKAPIEPKKKAKAPVIPKKPPPPIIDIGVLANEADSGRYPSMKRHTGEHDDICFICKRGGDLHGCDFCPKTVHMECIRTKHTIKDPEPEDDFMCHRCIQYIMQRRNRAEKRRLMKQQEALKKNGHNVAALDEAEATGANPEEESDYHAVTSLGQELGELTELLQDAQSRLRQAIGLSQMNEIRRSLLDMS